MVPKRELERLLQTESYAEVNAMNKTVYEEGIDKGRREGLVEMVFALLENKFGPVSAELRADLEQLSMEKLKQLALRIPTAATMAELGLPVVAPPG
jgi:hypothetical protein